MDLLLHLQRPKVTIEGGWMNNLPPQQQPNSPPPQQQANPPPQQQANPPPQQQPKPTQEQPKPAQEAPYPFAQRRSNTPRFKLPSGLKPLSQNNQLLVQQAQGVSGESEANHKFLIKTDFGEEIYHADEVSSGGCGHLRPFEMHIMDVKGKHRVMKMNRPRKCDSCCFPCCLQTMEVYAPPDNIAGSVEQRWSISRPSFVLKNQLGDTYFMIRGPHCTMKCGGDVEFDIMSGDGDMEVGKIVRQWAGDQRVAVVDADSYYITFPDNLDVRMKAVILGACFLIDGMFYAR